MEFGLTTPWNPPGDGADNSQNSGMPSAIPDRILGDAGLPPDGSVNPSAVDALLSHVNDYLASQRATPVPGTDASPSGVPVAAAAISEPIEPQTAAYPRENTLKPVPMPAPVEPPVYDEFQAPPTPVSEVVVASPRHAATAAKPIMSISDSGAKFIRDFEGLGPVNRSNTVTYEYPDAVKKPTIGWGHLLPKFGTYPQGISKTQAEDTFKADLQKYVDLVKARVRIPLTQNQFDALTSLAYNAPAALNPKSGFLTALNRGDYAAAAAIIPQYNKARARASDPLKPLKGLTVRRNEEQDMFLNGTYNSDH